MPVVISHSSSSPLQLLKQSLQLSLINALSLSFVTVIGPSCSALVGAMHVPRNTVSDSENGKGYGSNKVLCSKCKDGYYITGEGECVRKCTHAANTTLCGMSSTTKCLISKDEFQCKVCKNAKHYVVKNGLDEGLCK
eukprot:Pgem_evm1s4666